MVYKGSPGQRAQMDTAARWSAQTPPDRRRRPPPPLEGYLILCPGPPRLALPFFTLVLGLVKGVQAGGQAKKRLLGGSAHRSTSADSWRRRPPAPLRAAHSLVAGAAEFTPTLLHTHSALHKVAAGRRARMDSTAWWAACGVAAAAALRQANGRMRLLLALPLPAQPPCCPPAAALAAQRRACPRRRRPAAAAAAPGAAAAGLRLRV